MKAQVFTFHMAYKGLESRIWRDVEVSSKTSLDQLGYVVLATFDTMAYHLFEIHFRKMVYAIPSADAPSEQLDMAKYRLEELQLKLSDQIEMIYDFGTEQHFLLTLCSIRDMKPGEGRHFPWVTDMGGRGIIDDMSAQELAKLIRQIDKNGKTKEPVYYSSDGVGDGRIQPAPWDINRFNLKNENALLKGRVEEIRGGYAPFWENED